MISARRTVKNITYHLICRHKDHPFFKQFYQVLPRSKRYIYRFTTIQGNRSPRKTYLEYTDTRTTRANHHGNTPRRTYQIRKTITRI